MDDETQLRELILSFINGTPIGARFSSSRDFGGHSNHSHHLNPGENNSQKSTTIIIKKTRNDLRKQIGSHGSFVPKELIESLENEGVTWINLQIRESGPFLFDPVPLPEGKWTLMPDPKDQWDNLEEENYGIFAPVELL